MIHRFDLRFSSGDTLTLAVDMSVTPATFAASSMELANRFPAEYEMWLHEVVVPGLLKLAKAEQIETFAAKGAEVLQ